MKIVFVFQNKELTKIYPPQTDICSLCQDFDNFVLQNNNTTNLTNLIHKWSELYKLALEDPKMKVEHLSKKKCRIKAGYQSLIYFPQKNTRFVDFPLLANIQKEKKQFYKKNITRNIFREVLSYLDPIEVKNLLFLNKNVLGIINNEYITKKFKEEVNLINCYNLEYIVKQEIDLCHCGCEALRDVHVIKDNLILDISTNDLSYILGRTFRRTIFRIGDIKFSERLYLKNLYSGYQAGRYGNTGVVFKDTLYSFSSELNILEKEHIHFINDIKLSGEDIHAIQTKTWYMHYYDYSNLFLIAVNHLGAMFKINKYNSSYSQMTPEIKIFKKNYLIRRFHKPPRYETFSDDMSDFYFVSKCLGYKNLMIIWIDRQIQIYELDKGVLVKTLKYKNDYIDDIDDRLFKYDFLLIETIKFIEVFSLRYFKIVERTAKILRENTNQITHCLLNNLDTYNIPINGELDYFIHDLENYNFNNKTARFEGFLFEKSYNKNIDLVHNKCKTRIKVLGNGHIVSFEKFDMDRGPNIIFWKFTNNVHKKTIFYKYMLFPKFNEDIFYEEVVLFHKSGHKNKMFDFYNINRNFQIVKRVYVPYWKQLYISENGYLILRCGPKIKIYGQNFEKIDSKSFKSNNLEIKIFGMIIFILVDNKKIILWNIPTNEIVRAKFICVYHNAIYIKNNTLYSLESKKSCEIEGNQTILNKYYINFNENKFQLVECSQINADPQWCLYIEINEKEDILLFFSNSFLILQKQYDLNFYFVKEKKIIIDCLAVKKVREKVYLVSNDRFKLLYELAHF
jgi:hypothetical protein